MKRFIALLCAVVLLGSFGFSLPTAADAPPYTNLFDPDAARCGTVADNGTAVPDFRHWSSAVLSAKAGDVLCFGPVDAAQTERLVYWVGGTAFRPTDLTVADTFDNGQQILQFTMPNDGTFAVIAESAYRSYYTLTKNDPFTVTDFYRCREALGENLYLKELGYWGCYVDSNGDGKALKTNVNHNSTGLIPVKAGDTVTFGPCLTTQSFHGSAFTADLQFADNAIKAGELTKTALFEDGSSIFTYTVPNGVAYLRIVNRTTYRNFFYVAKNNVFDVAEYHTLKGTDPESPLIGKKALYLGDSICRGASDLLYTGVARDTWGGRIAEQFDMTYTKAGKSGASFSTCRDNRVLAQVESYKNNDYDYVILQGGINDAMDAVPVGTVSESFEPSSFDPSTFAGAMEELIYKTVLYYGDTAAIGYIVTFAATAYNSRTFDPVPYFAAARKICEKWGIEYIDLATPTMNELIGVASTRYLPDHLHPNTAGYDLLTPYIADWMETLTPYDGILNLYDHANGQGGYYNTDGTVVAHSAHRVVEKLTVAAGDTLYYGPANAGQSFQLIYWNESGSATKVGKNHVTTGLSVYDTFADGSVIYAYTPSAAGTVGIVTSVSYDEQVIVTKNRPFTAEEHAAYWDYTPEEEILFESVLNGKSAYFVGDSITRAARDSTTGLSGWAGRVGKYYQLGYFVNGGVSGTSLSTTRLNGSGLIKWQVMKEAAYHYDYIILHGGVNDAWDKVEVGAMTDSFKVEDFDTSTFAGGLEELFYYTTKYHSESAIGYLINFKLGSTAGNLSDMSAYVAEAIRICEKWKIPYLDMYNHAEITAALQMTTTLHTTDYIHPNSSGYDVLYPYIGEWMETLTPYMADSDGGGERHIVACVGDSITKGEESGDVNRYSYPAQLQDMLGEDYKVLNLGWGGATAQLNTSNPYKKTIQFKESLTCDPDTVIVMLGSNDAKEENWTSAAAYKADLTALVKEYQALNSNPEIYLASPASAKEGSSWNDVFDGGLVAAVEEVAAELGCTYLDINGLTAEIDPNLYQGTAHFGREGYDILAGHFYTALTGKVYTAPSVSGPIEVDPEIPLMQDYAFYPDAVQYRLESAKDVAEFGDLIAAGNSFEGKTVLLMNDIDFEGLDFRPLGGSTGMVATTAIDYSRAFSGTFDGQGHVFKNVTIRAMWYDTALFPVTWSATIQNFGLVGGCVEGYDVVGSIVGYGDGATHLINVWSSADVFAASRSSVQGSGGLASNMRRSGTGKSAPADRYSIMENVAYYGTLSGCANLGGLAAWGQSGGNTLQVNTAVFAGVLEIRDAGGGAAEFVRYGAQITGNTADFYGANAAQGNVSFDDASRTYLPAADYKNGKAAYALGWSVKDGLTVPMDAPTYKILFGETETYTDYRGTVIGDVPTGYWTDGKAAYTALTVKDLSFTADTRLISTQKGDVSLNGTLDTADAVLLLQYLVGFEIYADPLVSDTNGSGSISIADAVMLLRLQNQ